MFLSLVSGSNTFVSKAGKTVAGTRTASETLLSFRPLGPHLMVSSGARDAAGPADIQCGEPDLTSVAHWASVDDAEVVKFLRELRAFVVAYPTVARIFIKLNESLRQTVERLLVRVKCPLLPSGVASTLMAAQFAGDDDGGVPASACVSEKQLTQFGWPL